MLKDLTITIQNDVIEKYIKETNNLEYQRKDIEDILIHQYQHNKNINPIHTDIVTNFAKRFVSAAPKQQHHHHL
jgi:hypothetical protein